MEEIWKDINGLEGYYQISNFGRVKSLERIVKTEYYTQKRRERILKNNTDTKGYAIISLSVNAERSNFKIHRLVAEHFILNPEDKPCVNHKDFNKKNNRSDNLEWVTWRENTQHYHKTHNKLTGASRHKNKFRATIYRGGAQEVLGYFNTKEDAHKAYVEALSGA